MFDVFGSSTGRNADFGPQPRLQSPAIFRAINLLDSLIELSKEHPAFLGGTSDQAQPQPPHS